MKRAVLSLLMLLTLSSTSFAVPVLQVGVPGPTPGTYLPYLDWADPEEADTALTTGNTIVVGGVQAPNAVHLGGGFAGEDWSTATNDEVPTAFDGHGALLLVTYSVDASASSSSLKISSDGGNSYHSSDISYSSLFFPNNHAPLQDSSVSGYAYFDLGSFSFNGTVANFADPGDTANGELKTILFQFTGIDWAHFDVMALETSETGNHNIQTTWDFENNPASHDATWQSAPPTVVPEPGSVILVALGLATLGCYTRRRQS